MIKISQTVTTILGHDDVASAALRKGWLNLSAYARDIRPQVQEALLKDVREGSIVTALSRLVPSGDEALGTLSPDKIQSLAVHTNLDGITYERSDAVSASIQEVYHKMKIDNKTFLTVTQGINEITIIAEARVARLFRDVLPHAQKIYDKSNLVGITAKFAPGYLEIPNLIFILTRRLAYRDINIIEIVSTATELTFFVEKKDMPLSLEQLQKDI
ncbi:MAG TPA: hypothetical protein VNG90_04665 [Candidatus Acidoferrum sp.]|nr:hypothetical protein [Candidatus Acidoferrum sp.]